MANEDGSSRRIVSKKVKVSVNNHFVTMLKDLIGESNVWVS
jgi:DNA polymerase-3 subunit alpha